MKIKRILMILCILSLCFMTTSCSNKNEKIKDVLIEKQITTSKSLVEDEFTSTKAKLDEQYNELFPNKDLSNYEMSEEIAKITDKWNDLSEKYIKLSEDKFNKKLSEFVSRHDNRDIEGYLKRYKDFISNLDEKNKTELEMFKSINDVVTDGASSSVAIAKYEYELSREKALKIYDIYNLLNK